MTTSRTGTGAWVRLRQQALRTLPLVCAHCTTTLDPKAPRSTPQSPELDHIIPWSKGGQDTLENVQWLCAPCNQSKNNGRSPKRAPQLIRVRTY